MQERIAPSPHQKLRRDLRNRCGASLTHVDLQFFAQQGKDGFDSGLAEGGERPEIGAADADGAGSHGEGFEEIRAASEAAIDEHGHLAVYGVDDLGQAADAGAFAVFTAATVV